MARLFASSPRLLLLAAVWLFPHSVMATTPASGYPSLVQLWTQWRQFEPPVIKNCVPDYSGAAMAEKALRLAAFQPGGSR